MNIVSNKTYRLLLLIILMGFQLDAISQRFNAGVQVGLNAAQLDGDDSAGYNKLGIMAGLRGVTILTEKMEVSIELLFSQKGAKCELSSNGLGTRCGLLDIKLNYVEIPLLFNYKDWRNEEKDYYKMLFSAGFSYGRLIGGSATNNAGDDASIEGLNKNDFSIIVGATYFATSRLGISFRYTRSMNLAYNASKQNNFFTNSLNGHLLGFYALYMFL